MVSKGRLQRQARAVSRALLIPLQIPPASKDVCVCVWVEEAGEA